MMTIIGYYRRSVLQIRFTKFKKILKKIIYILILAVLFGCSDSREKLNIDRMKMDIEMYLEFEPGGYYISWNDTLCSEFNSDWNYLQKRPYELYCHIFNTKRDTLGYYRGLSSPRQFTYFQTKQNWDSIIDLEFSVGINHFSEFLAEQSEDYIESFNERFDERIEFKPVRVNLRTDLNKKKEIELINRKN